MSVSSVGGAGPFKWTKKLKKDKPQQPPPQPAPADSTGTNRGDSIPPIKWIRV